jgi:hypothetical protein
MRNLKIIPRSLNKIVLSWIPSPSSHLLQQTALCSDINDGVTVPSSRIFPSWTGQTRTDNGYFTDTEKAWHERTQERAFAGISCMQDRKLLKYKRKERTNLGQKQKRKDREETFLFVRKGRETAPIKRTGNHGKTGQHKDRKTIKEQKGFSSQYLNVILYMEWQKHRWQAR